MVLYGDGENRHFDPYLLTYLKKIRNTEVLRILRNYRDEDLSLKDSSESTLLHYAAEYENLHIVQYLLDHKCEINAQNKQGCTPLMLTVQQGHEIVFEALLKANADINLTDVQAKTALHMIFELAPMCSTMLKILFQLVTYQKILEGIAPNVLATKLKESNYTGQKALESENAGIIQVLLGHKVTKPSDRDPHFGNTLLHKAVRMKNLEIIRVLVDYGADVDALNSCKSTPLRYLYSITDNENDSAKNLEILKVLISRAKLLTTSDDLGFMQISNVLEHGNDEAIKLIFQSNIDFRATDEKGNTLLHWLARNRNVDHCTLLRRRIFDLNAQNQEGFTPLHLAAKQFSPKAIRFLLKSGADVDLTNKLEQTALYILFEHNIDKPIMQSANLFLEYGADPQTKVTNEYQDRLRIRIYTLFDLLMNNQIVQSRTEEYVFKVEPVIARLAILQGSGTKLVGRMFAKINPRQYWKRPFEACQKQVRQMKDTIVHGNVTLFQFLADSDRKVLAYFRNKELVTQLRMCIDNFDENSPYADILRIHLERIIQLTRLKEKAINCLSELIDVNNTVRYSIAEIIVEYLMGKDMKNLVLSWIS